MVEKIPYLKALGVTAIELLPVKEFEECDHSYKNPETGERLCNFWGYQPLSFFAPKASYSAAGTTEGAVRSFREMVKALHEAGIEVILDMVFNHTGEGTESGPTCCFRGLDNEVYYLADPRTGKYLDFSGCGNTLRCNHPVVRSLILTALRYWVTEMHVDGFRFDLASILGRDRATARCTPIPPPGDHRRRRGAAPTPRSSPRPGTPRASTRWAASPPGVAGPSGTASSATRCADSSRATPASWERS